MSARLNRRAFLRAGGAALGVVAFGPRRVFAADVTLPPETLSALEASPLVYVSPLKSDGAESFCHGEVWYFWDTETGSVVLATGKDRWKTRAIEGGLDRARIWVGDFGRGQKGPHGTFREGPTFLARAVIDSERATFDRLLKSFAVRYEDEWGKWGPRFEKGWSEGSRVVIRYTPIDA